MFKLYIYIYFNLGYVIFSIAEKAIQKFRSENLKISSSIQQRQTNYKIITKSIRNKTDKNKCDIWIAVKVNVEQLVYF